MLLICSNIIIYKLKAFVKISQREFRGSGSVHTSRLLLLLWVPQWWQSQQLTFKQGNSLDIKLYTRYSTSARSDCSVGVEGREWCGGGEGSTLSLSHSLPLSPLALSNSWLAARKCLHHDCRTMMSGGGGLTMTKLFTNFNFYNRIKGVLTLRIKE